MKELVLLGIWDEPPLVVWPWFADNSAEHFHSLTGFKMVPFTYRKDGPHPQYLLADETEKLHLYFESLPDDQKAIFVNKICSNYFSWAEKVMPFIKGLQKKDFSKLNTNDIIEMIKELCNKLSFVTIQAWFILLLDVWYPELKERIGLKEMGAKARDHSGHLHNNSKKVLEKMVFQLSKRVKIKEEDIYLLFPDEVGMLVNKKERAILCKKISLRRKLLVTTSVSGKYSIFEGKKAQLLLKKYLPAREKQARIQDILKGQPVCMGRARGKARVVLLHNQFKDFKTGEILVALQTMVNFVPLMKKAGAIITEIGGITSHAAIVSRELGKPCIVGISGLTKSINTGDMIEVDADKGVVRKIK